MKPEKKAFYAAATIFLLDTPLDILLTEVPEEILIKRLSGRKPYDMSISNADAEVMCHRKRHARWPSEEEGHMTRVPADSDGRRRHLDAELHSPELN